MNAQGLTSGGIAFAIAFGTALLALWSQPGVASFGDITPVAYAAACVGAAVGALTTYQARMKESPQA